MKRNLKWIVVSLLVLTIIVLLVFPIGRPLQLPFEADEVSSVILWSFWGYKEVTEVDDIAQITEKMNGIRICGAFDFENYEPRDGDYSYVCTFYLTDGSTYQYSTMQKPGLTSIFMDADGTYHKAKNVRIQSVFENLDLELRQGNPFPAK